MKKVLLLTTMFFLITTIGYSQTNRFWTENKQDKAEIVTDKSVARLSYPAAFKLFNLNSTVLRQELFSVVGQRASKQSVVISLPNADGGIESFEVFEASNFEPDLQARFPEIRAYSGRGITDRYATLKLSISPQGIQTMVFRTDKANEFIEPYSKDHSIYAVYRSHREKGKLPWTCSTDDKQMFANTSAQIPGESLTGSSTGQLKTMRLAQSCNGEYANYFGATSSAQVGLVLAAFNATLTRCNGVYEKDLALHLNLISNTTSVIYYNPATDPYSTTLSQWNAQLQSTLTSVIGEANYDIGHMFGASGGGGNAGCIGCVCVNGSKGSGITSPADGIPQGDNFDIDYVTHEVGHQLGGNHTFSMSNEGTGVNKEVGSGITIMGYAGITAQDVAPHSIDIFHQATINQIQTNLAGKTCPVSFAMTANSAPSVAAVSNRTIPISTPFELTASATDPENDPLTYCWEQNDNSTTTGTGSVASPTKTTGPNWLSFPASVSGSRTFPRLSTILAGLNVTPPLPGGDAGANIEALSSVSRTLNFRVTARDNRPYVVGSTIGQTAFTDAVITVTNTSGPFAVTAPNTNVIWAGASTQTVTWSVNNTTAAPVSCANVKISMSTDGGQTFPTVLAESTPNDGSEAVVIPNTASTTARVKVEAVGNIFFDISNSNFTIGAAAACGDATGLTASSVTNTSATVSWSAVTNAVSYTVDYKANSSSTWISVSTAQTGTSANLAGLTEGTLYDWRVKANCNAGSGAFVQAQFTTTAPCNAPAGLSSSSITSSGATVSWSAVSGAISYDVDYKLSSTSTWTNSISGTTSTSRSITGLLASTLYDWRVITNCSGGSSAYAQAQFTTGAVAPGCGTAFEPNESIAAAAPVTLGVTNSAAITTTTDNDYFSVVTTGVNNMVYSLVGPSGVDYDLTIYNSSGTSIGTGVSASATETVSLTNQAAGTYYIRVFGYNGANSATCYTITATATPVAPTTCPGIYDISTNGTRTGAALIPFNTDIKGLLSPSGDNDYYRFVITTGGTITMTLTTLPANYQLRLLNSSGSTLQTSSNSGTTNETISRTVTAGTYYARVYPSGSANNAANCYTLKVQLGTASKEIGNEIVEMSADKLTIAPNPVGYKTNLLFMAEKAGSAEVIVTNQLGSVVLRKTIPVAEGENIRALDVSNLPNGFYYVRMQHGAKMQMAKIVVAK
ncbi:MAG: fibronectin type III domain-containing protein [Chitinophagaceae bacterium]|nr:fibronectin type III domain-containing protein [Chitinophagaceae bacterium]